MQEKQEYLHKQLMHNISKIKMVRGYFATKVTTSLEFSFIADKHMF